MELHSTTIPLQYYGDDNSDTRFVPKLKAAKKQRTAHFPLSKTVQYPTREARLGSLSLPWLPCQDGELAFQPQYLHAAWVESWVESEFLAESPWQGGVKNSSSAAEPWVHTKPHRKFEICIFHCVTETKLDKLAKNSRSRKPATSVHHSLNKTLGTRS